MSFDPSWVQLSVGTVSAHQALCSFQASKRKSNPRKHAACTFFFPLGNFPTVIQAIRFQTSYRIISAKCSVCKGQSARSKAHQHTPSSTPPTLGSPPRLLGSTNTTGGKNADLPLSTKLYLEQPCTLYILYKSKHYDNIHESINVNKTTNFLTEAHYVSIVGTQLIFIESHLCLTLM